LEITFAGSEFELVTVDSAEAALEKVKTASPALVIADVSLPPNDGYELCSTIKLAAPSMPVLMLSSKQNPFDPSKGAQADGHIDKPFDTQVLQDKARALVKSDKAVDTDAPPARAPAKPVAMPDRTPQSGKIPAPRRKRPTPAMMAKPEITAKKEPPGANVRRTVPFAMPGASKGKPELGNRGAGTKPMGQREQAASQALGQNAQRSAPRPERQSPAPVVAAQKRAKPPMSDTLPGVQEGAKAQAPGARAPSSPKPAATIESAPQPAASAGAVSMSPETATDLQGKLEGMGLNEDQINGVLALSRDLVEQVVWEVVPVLAETLIKEEIKRLTKS
jgi:CheY-like chemotaxis protein